MFEVEASLMCANPLDIGHDAQELQRAGVDFFHLDVMDGHFVPNLALSFNLIHSLRAATSVPIDVHLMVANPEDYVDTIAEHRVERVCFHIEATRDPIRLASKFRKAGAAAGIAINPSTTADALQYVISEIDYILVMTVEPGFAGQKFLPAMLHKLTRLRKMLRDDAFDIPIAVDGNLDSVNGANSVQHGASILVGGTSSIFRRDIDVYAACVQFREEVIAALKRSPVEAR